MLKIIHTIFMTSLRVRRKEFQVLRTEVIDTVVLHWSVVYY